MRLNEVGIKQYQSATILNESWQQLSEAQQLHVGRWESRVWPLVEQYSRLLEQELTPDQIEKIFTSAEQVAKASGNNQTALGKAGKVTAEVTGKMKAEIEKLMKAAQDSGPIKNMDQQFDKIRSQLANKLKGNPAGQKILQGVDKWKTFADENPAKSAFIIGAMTSILAFSSGGIVSGAAIGFFLKLANNTIKGDKLSTALAKGVKGAAIGAIAGAIGSTVSGLDFGEPEFEGGPADVDITSSSDEIASAGGEEAAQALADMTEEQFKETYAREMLERQAEKFNMPVTDEMVKKVADNIDITGNYPDNYDANFEGTFVRGTTYLTPDEAQEYSRIVQANGGGMEGHFSKEANEFIKDAGGSGPNVVPDTPDDDLDAATGGDDEPEADTGSSDPRQSADWDELEDFEKSYELLSKVPAEDWTPEEFKIVKAEGDLSPMKTAEYFAVRPDAVLKYSGGSTMNTEDFLKQIMGDEAWEAASNTEKEDALDYLQPYVLAAKNESLEEQIWSALDAYELREAPAIAAALGGAARGIGKVASKGADIVGKAAAKGVSKAGSAVKSVGNELGNIVTAKKLMRMWTKSGKPTDMGSIVNILNQAGISDEQIGTVGKQARIPLEKPKNANSKDATGTAQVDPKLQTLADEIKKLGLADLIKPKLAGG